MPWPSPRLGSPSTMARESAQSDTAQPQQPMQNTLSSQEARDINPICPLRWCEVSPGDRPCGAATRPEYRRPEHTLRKVVALSMPSESRIARQECVEVGSLPAAELESPHAALIQLPMAQAQLAERLFFAV